METVDSSAGWEESFGRCLIEAIAMQKWVISTNVGGPTEIVEDGVNGVLVPPKNPNVIAQAVIELASKRKKGEEMGKRGRKEVQRRFNTVTYVARILTIYERALHERNLEKTR